MKTLLIAVTVYLVLASPASAQDPTTTLPDNYKVELDNNYVRIVRVHYDAGATLPDHTHPAGTTVYVYLNDSEGVVFKHSSGSSRSVTRPPVKAGAIRISTGPEEHHAVDNTSSAASDFLRIFLKTDGGGSRSVRRIPPTEMEFSNKQLRVTRLMLQPGEKTLVETKNMPALRIAIAAGTTAWKVPPKDALRWLDPGTTEEFAVTGDLPVHLIRIDFLTKPK